MKIPPNKKLEPSESHRIKIEKVIKKLRTLFKISFNVFGSIAKDTYIGNHKELDLFFEGPSLEQTLEILSKDLKEPSFSRVKEKRAGHPYYTVIFKYLGVNWSLDLVPFTGIKGLSEVERSKLHVCWVLQQKKYKTLSSSSVRYIKNLLSEYELYGAESSIEGISGYAVEVLCNNCTDIEEIVLKLNKKELLDPCDPNRNLFSSLSDNNFYRLKFLLKNLRKILKSKDSIKPLGRLYSFKATSFQNELEEQTRKRMKRIIRELEESNSYYGSYWSHKKKILYLLMDSWFDYGEAIKINNVTTEKLLKVNEEFYQKNKGSFNLSNIGIPRLVKKKQVNFNNYFEINGLSRIPLTKKLKERFFKLSLCYIK